MKFKIKFITLAIISLFFSKLVSAETAPGFGSWDDVLKAANGGQVNVYMWGGSDAINGFVDASYTQQKTDGSSSRNEAVSLDEVELDFLFNVGSVSGEIHLDNDNTLHFC